MEFRSGGSRPRHLIRYGLLLIALLLCAAAAVRSPLEAAYRKAREVSQSDPPAALKIAEEALRTADNQGEWYWALQFTRAEMLVTGGRMEEVRKILEPELPGALRKTEAAVRRLLALAIVAHYYKDPELAKKLANDGLTLATKHVPALRGDAYLRRGNIALSESDLREALRLARLRKDEILAANAEASLVYVYHRADRISDALEVAERVVPRLTALNMKRTIAGNTINLASLYDTMGDYETAKEVFASTQAELGRMGMVPERIVFLDRLGDAYLATRDLDTAARWYSEAAALAKPIGHRQYSRSLSNLAQIAIARKRFDEARTLIEDAIEEERKRGEHEDEMRARVIRARLDIATGHSEVAERELKDIVSKTQTSITRWQAEARLGNLYAAQKRTELAHRNFALALDIASKARKELKDDHRFAYFNGVAELFDSYVDSLVANQQIEKALEVTEERRARTLAEGLKMEASLRKLDPRAIAKRHNATILCYWLGSRHSYVWTVTAASVTLQHLPAAQQIEAGLDQYRKDLLNPLTGTLEGSMARGQKLFRTLVEPAIRGGLARESKVIVIADGKLHSLNFETLIVPTPKAHWWIEDVILASAGSLQLLAHDAAPRASKNAMLLVGDPPSADRAFPKLANAGQEMEKVGAHFPQKTVLRGAEATPSAFLAAKPSKYDLIHFVAHGTAMTKKPLESAVILAREKKGDGYKLYASEIIKQPLSARLVTISSCHGAGKRSYAGEGLVGLAWAFLRAGAGEVVAALWEVDDRATPELMNRMYAQIRGGSDPAVALREAKLAMVRSKTNHRMPRYWAPFILYAGS